MTKDLELEDLKILWLKDYTVVIRWGKIVWEMNGEKLIQRNLQPELNGVGLPIKSFCVKSQALYRK